MPWRDYERKGCLGINIYIDSICSKVGASIGAMRRVKPFIPLSTTKMLYNAIIQPYFDYCSPLWDNCGIGLNDRLQKYQNRAARVITGATYDIRSSELLDNLNWKSLKERRNYLKSIFIYKILNAPHPVLKKHFNLIMKDIIHTILEIGILI